MAKDLVRLDVLLVERGLCESRSRAAALVAAGQVMVGDHRVDKAGARVARDVTVRLREADHPFVSRGGVKLQAALATFATAEPHGLRVAGRIAMDVGASTGGFTDCLLRAGAARVHAVDVGHGQLAWKLVGDPRVVVHDRRNIRALASEEIGEPVEVVTVDCSFIGLAKVLPCLPPFLAPGADLVALIKPQFELGPQRVGKGGIVREPEAHAEAIASVRAHAVALGWAIAGEVPSPIPGRDGNREFLLWCRTP